MWLDSHLLISIQISELDGTIAGVNISEGVQNICRHVKEEHDHRVYEENTCECTGDNVRWF